ncbi:MAG: Rpn family recombination-promoting nuclease/putative transposase [Moraxellaceae bacterium]|nr:Rpn family recombination-promoting nuclease/putative transposase [Moraxellaceae bacterium]
MSIFLNPYTDYGFKKIFGEEASKPQLMDFLNSLLPSYHQIKNLNFRNTEQLGLREYDRKAIYDIFCESITGEQFIVELQKSAQTYFIDRSLYYSTFPIQKQAPKGNWDYKLSAVYCIGILDFTFSKDTEQKDVIHTVNLKNQHNEIVYDKLSLIYLEMPNFNKQENELKTRIDKWLYFLKHLEDFQEIPNIFHDPIFEQAFEVARLAKMNENERLTYQNSLKVLWDNHSQITTAYGDGHKEGKEEGIEIGIEKGRNKEKQKIALNMKQKGIDNMLIAEITGLTLAEITSVNN